MRKTPSLVLKTPSEFSDEAKGILASDLASDDALDVGADPHLHLAWFALLAEAAMPVGASLSLQVLTSSADGAHSYLPLMILPDENGKIFGLSNFYTPLFGLTDEARADASLIERLAVDLRKGRPRYAVAQFSPMDPESRSFTLLKSSFKRAGWQVDDYFCFVNWFERIVPGDSAAYFRRRPSQLKNTIRRAEQKLGNTPGYKLEIFQHPDESLEQAIAAYVQVYSRSWKEPEPYPQFIPGLCRLAANKGWLRLGVIFLAQKPIAAQLWLVVAGKAHIVKLAYDQDHSKTSAGTVLSAALFRHVIDVDRVEEIDYLMGDDQYKQNWMNSRRERRGVIAFNLRTVFGLALAARHVTGKFWRRLRRCVS
ncbi:MAG: GNAT family N-acetyltransferase [Rhodocyclaceae bacterium]|nr:GNAT family N-acetyltransferase [Rhodocyclaceae bacterium]